MGSRRIMIDNLKPVGAFIENTIRPLISEAKWFLSELEHQGIKVTEENITRICKQVAKIHIITLMFELIKVIIIASLIAWAFCKIYNKV